MTVAHTPGPWAFHAAPHRAGHAIEGHILLQGAIDDEPCVAYVEGVGSIDLSLILAAPELLAALESILRAYTDAEAGRLGIDPEDAWKARAGIPPWVERIVMPAIRKAKGGAS